MCLNLGQRTAIDLASGSRRSVRAMRLGSSRIPFGLGTSKTSQVGLGRRETIVGSVDMRLSVTTSSVRATVESHAGCVEGGYALGHWVTKQRHALRQLPDDERHQRLARLAGWTWEPYDDRWENAYRLLKAFSEAEGHCDVPQSYSIDGTRLGGWVGQQRLKHRQGQLSQDRSDRLEALPGWTWSTVAEWLR